MKDEQKAAHLRELVSLSIFEGQTALEDAIYQSNLNKITSLEISSPNVALEYARLRGSLDVLTQLRKLRDQLVEAARSRSNS